MTTINTTTINTTTNQWADTREEMPLPVNKGQEKAPDLHNPEDGPNSEPFGTGEPGASRGPSSEKSKTFVDEVHRLIRRGAPGVHLLYLQLQTGRFPSLASCNKMSRGEILNLLKEVLELEPFGVGIFELLVLDENPKIDLGCLSPEESNTLANKLLERGLAGMNLIKRLASEDKLPNFQIRRPKEFVDFCVSLGAPGLSLLQVFVDKGKLLNLDPSEFSREEAKAIADKLSDYDLPGRDLLAKLVKQKKIPSLASLEDIPACTPKVVHGVNPRQTLENAVRRAFFGKTDGIGEEEWADVRTRLETMPPREARGIWQRIANEVAVTCFDGNGRVDVANLKTLMDFLRDAESFKREPLCLIPHAEFMGSQMYGVCKCLWDNQNDARDRLDEAASITLSQYGQSILDTMSLGMEHPLHPGIAILASLFAPHRQPEDMPTCTIDSLINAEIRNHLERLIEIYIRMLSKSQFTLPSGYPVQLQPMVGGFITVDLRGGGKGKEAVFGNITGGDPAKASRRIKDWELAGIGYDKSADEAEKYKLKMPVHNMNDVLFTHLFRVSNFGNAKIDDPKDFGVMLAYAGHTNGGFQHTITPSSGKTVLAELQEQAKVQQKLGYRYMRVSTEERVWTVELTTKFHAENIDIDALLALDPNTMKKEKYYYPIGDRNHYGYSYGYHMSWDIPHLAIKKIYGFSTFYYPETCTEIEYNTPAFEFGVPLYGSQFEESHIRKINIYRTDVEVHDAEFWDQYAP